MYAMSGSVGPEHPEAKAPDAVDGAGSGGDDAHAPAPGLRKGVVLVGARRRDGRVEDELDRQPAQDLGRAADVVALGVREHEHCEPADSEPAELAGDVRLGRALVDEDRAFGDLEQRGVALTDVERGQAEAAWRRR